MLVSPYALISPHPGPLAGFALGVLRSTRRNLFPPLKSTALGKHLEAAVPVRAVMTALVEDATGTGVDKSGAVSLIASHTQLRLRIAAYLRATRYRPTPCHSRPTSFDLPLQAFHCEQPCR